MKTFETPYVDIEKFQVADVLTASADTAEETEEVYVHPCI